MNVKARRTAGIPHLSVDGMARSHQMSRRVPVFSQLMSGQRCGALSYLGEMVRSTLAKE
jgi:hypothetical protein